MLCYCYSYVFGMLMSFVIVLLRYVMFVLFCCVMICMEIHVYVLPQSQYTHVACVAYPIPSGFK